MQALVPKPAFFTVKGEAPTRKVKKVGNAQSHNSTPGLRPSLSPFSVLRWFLAQPPLPLVHFYLAPLPHHCLSFPVHCRDTNEPDRARTNVNGEAGLKLGAETTAGFGPGRLELGRQQSASRASVGPRASPSSASAPRQQVPNPDFIQSLTLTTEQTKQTHAWIDCFCELLFLGLSSTPVFFHSKFISCSSWTLLF